MITPIITTQAQLPLFSSRVPAGFPSPCDPHIQKRLNIHEYLVDQEDATFMVTVWSWSLRDIGILPNDFAVVNRAAEAKVGNIVLAVVNGEFTLKLLNVSKQGNPILESANPDFKPIIIREGMDFEIWGVVTGTFRRYVVRWPRLPW